MRPYLCHDLSGDCWKAYLGKPCIEVILSLFLPVVWLLGGGVVACEAYIRRECIPFLPCRSTVFHRRFQKLWPPAWRRPRIFWKCFWTRQSMCLGMFTLSFLMLSFIYRREREAYSHTNYLAVPPCKSYARGYSLEICEVTVRELSTICRLILLGHTLSVCSVAVLLEVTVQFSSSVNSLKNGTRINRT